LLYLNKVISLSFDKEIQIKDLNTGNHGLQTYIYLLCRGEGLGYGIECHFQQYFSYVVAV